MPLLIITLLLIILAYQAFIRGLLWKGILVIAAPICIHRVLLETIPITRHTALILAHYPISWAAFLPAALMTLVLLTHKERDL